MYTQVDFLSFEISTYVALYLVAMGVGAVLIRHEFRRRGYPPRFHAVFVGVVLASALVGAKLYYVIGHWSQVVRDPQSALSISGSGWYGGFLFGGAAALVTIRLARLPVLQTLDLLAPVLPLCQAIGRLGCFLGGCCHGTPSSVPWALAFPDGQYPPYVRVHPTQLYEMVVYLGVFWFLWRKRETLGPGQPLGLYLLLVGGGRFLSEIYRLNPKIFLQLSTQQILAVLGMVVGAVLVSRLARTMPEEPVRGA